MGLESLFEEIVVPRCIALPRVTPFKPHGSHKPFRGVAGNLESLSMQLTPDLPRAVYFMILFPDTSYLAFVELVLLTARRELFRSILEAF
jgi:hypothetical protein